MAKIPLSSGFRIIPEGKYTFLIADVIYNEDFGKLTLKLIADNGESTEAKYNLLNNDGTFNEKALGAFSMFAKAALNDYTRNEVDPMELKEHYVGAEITHNKVPSTTNPGEYKTYVNFKSTWAVEVPADTDTEVVDLDKLLE